MKTRSKKKVSDNKKESMKTGGGPNISGTMDEVDNKIVQMIGMLFKICIFLIGILSP